MNIDMKRYIFPTLILIVLSFIGGLLKVPSLVGSIAFDSAPAFFGALMYHPVVGGIVGGIGHLLSAYHAGFPLGPLVHFFVAVEMFAIALSFGIIFRIGKKSRHLVLAVLVGFILNGFVAPYSLIIIPTSPIAEVSQANGIVPILAITSICNILIGALAFWGLIHSRNRKL